MDDRRNATSFTASDDAPESSSLLATDELADDIVACQASGVQRGLWFLDRLQPGRAAYNVSSAFDLRGEIDWDALQASLNQLIARHEPLRTSFGARAGEPVQIIHASLSIQIARVSLVNQPAADTTARRLASEEAAVPFDLTVAPLLRARAFEIAPQHHLLVLTVHHIVSDGWSQVVFFEELGALYASHVEGRASSLPPVSIQYADFTVWHEKRLTPPRRAAQLDYWRTTLQDLPDPVELGADHPRPAMPSGRGGLEAWPIDASLTAALRATCRTENVTLFMAFIATLKVFLYRHSGQRDLIIGAPIAARPRQELERTIGFFANTVAIRTDLSGQPTFRDVLHRVRSAALGAYEHQDVPFFEVVQAARPDRSLMHTPVFQVMCVAQRVPDHVLTLPHVEVCPVPLGNGTSKFDLLVDVQERTDVIDASLEYNTDVFDTETCRRWIGRLTLLLAAACQHPDWSIDALPILTDDETRALAAWNDTSRPRDSRATVISLFDTRCRETPDAPALTFPGTGRSAARTLSYRALQERSDAMAAALRVRGARSGQLVGLCLDRSPEMVIALLGILKAGAAYLPLDPAFPTARLAFMVEDSGIGLVVTDEALSGLLPDRIERILVDPKPPGLPPIAEENRWPTPSPDDLAYVLYTSGSTGNPKGVEITHRCLSNFLLSMQHTPALSSADRLLAVTTMSFDIAGLEIYLPLITGATIVLAAREQASDPRELATLLDRADITVLQATPATWRLLLDAGWRGKANLKVLCGGEAMTRDLADRLLGVVPEVWNLYGPTETTVWSTVERVRPGHEAITIGRPIDNTEIYIVDTAMQQVPVGVVGELVIGGDGVGRGYLHRPDLTLDRFVPDAFSSRANGRLYRTGDHARFLRDGRIECLGRMDHQVKIRGYRIELGEIETLLNDQPTVRQAVVVARPDATLEMQLVAYVVPEHEASEDPAGVDRWRTLWDSAYASQLGNRGSVDPTFDTSGWRSSYTGELIPAEEMREWRDHTVERIRSLAPSRVLEIGCGTGLLLFPLAPGCEHYTAVDLSPSAIERIGDSLRATGTTNVTLHVSDALQAADAVTTPVDVVIINSVAQYFPSIDYLVATLERVLRVVTTGGHIFLGDIRSMPLLEAFHASVALEQAPDGSDTADVARRIRERIQREAELVVSPDFFEALRAALPRITHTSVLLKRGHAMNEMTRFRYDVVLQIDGPGGTVEPDARPAPGETTLDDIRREIGTHPHGAVVRGLLNPRVHADVVAAAHLLHEATPLPTAADVRRRVAATAGLGINPDDLHDAAPGYDVELTFSASAADRYDAFFRLRAGTQPVSITPAPEFSIWSRFANQPWAGGHADLVPVWRACLSEKLPGYMVPAVFTVLDALPLTPNGKIDRAALPAPQALTRTIAPDAVPESPDQQVLADIWQDVLGLTSVGTRDSFFELGGHSLAALRVFAQIESKLGVSLPLSTLFEANTIADLARVITRVRLGEGATPWRALVVIKEGDAPPLVCVHSLSGDVLEYRDIAKYLTGSQRVLGLQAVLSDNVEAMYRSLEATAAAYLAEVREAQPLGPYYLCGWSSGGSLALEMAQQLVAADDTVALLAIIDSAPPNIELREKPSSIRQLLRQLANIPAWVRDDLLLTPPAEMWARACHKLSVLSRRVRRPTHTMGDTVRDVVDFPRRNALWERFAAAHFGAFKSYAPKPYPGRVSLFTAPTHPLTWLNDPAPLWRQLAEKVDVHPAAGTHFSIVKEPNVQVLALAIEKAMEVTRDRAGTANQTPG